MKRFLILVSCVLATALVALASGCVHHRHGGHPGPVVVTPAPTGPPPHAPAHGYRHKHRRHGVDLVFDAGLGVYVVVGWPDVFFHHDHFYRLSDGIWQVSLRLDDGWRPCDDARLPKALAKKGPRAKGHGKARGRGKGKGKGKGKGPHPARHRY